MSRLYCCNWERYKWSSFIPFGHPMSQKSNPFPYSQIVFCLSVPSEASLRFLDINFYGVKLVVLMPNLQPGGPGYPFSCGSSPLTCPAWETLPVVTLPPACLSGSSDHTSPTLCQSGDTIRDKT
jgi:hypothetical protein